MSLTIRPALALAAIATLTLSACSEPAGDPMGGIPANDYVLVGIGNGTVPLRNTGGATTLSSAGADISAIQSPPSEAKHFWGAK